MYKNGYKPQRGELVVKMSDDANERPVAQDPDGGPTVAGQAQQKYKWGGQAIQVEQAKADQAYAAVESAFGKVWLERTGEHRLQKVWARNDFLAGYELYNFGESLQRVQRLDTTKARELVRAIRKGGTTAHGLLYEVHGLAMLANGGHSVAGTPKKTPGCDAIVRFDNGITMRWSFKNHDVSDRERVFRERCEKLYAGLHAQGGLGALERLLVIADRHLEAEDFAELTRSLRRLPRGQMVNVRPQVDALLSRVIAPAHEQPFAHDARSRQLTVVASHHPVEQSNFFSKMKKAAENMEKHCQRKPGFANVILMRVHPTADVPGLQKAATEMLQQPDCAVDAVVLHQPNVTREKESWSVVHHLEMAIGPNYPLSCPLSLVLPAGLVSNSPSPVFIKSDDQRIELAGRYLFQRGIHVREAQAQADGSMSSNHLGAPAEGIHEHAVFSINGQRIRLTGRHPASDELFLI